ncbi:tumor necrosis factor receptor superfamily member 5 isoform X2 [Amphiprion ocellaris]|uniref:tumor necrosis factor receptor superfamily member 5 isoform X2 n=1 Tax=Amphiprion ocellaris TaxID=80972 RepID=UPI002410D233|nr:tumor necrosis factor receptor superfamily member 5 isoform X2 [Amphiprion ocellaris]
MALMKHFVAVLMLSAHLVLTSPIQRTYRIRGKECLLCPAGEYQKSSCTECEVCPPGSYTTDWNREESCHPCYRDCSPEFHLKVVQNCSRTSDLKCSCESGFRCTQMSPLTENCRVCEKIQDTTTTAVKSARDEQTSSSASVPTISCSSPSCRPQSADSRDYSNKLLAAVLCPVVVVSCVAVVILFCFRRPGDETCFRQTVAKLCNEEGQNASHKSKESTRPFSRDSCKQQSSSVSAHLGSVHVHNPGTVIFSLLSHLSGQVGPTADGGKTERPSGGEEPDGGRPEFHPSSPHISEEERSHEADSIFFPSQEQGKDFHVSKEEAL